MTNAKDNHCNDKRFYITTPIYYPSNKLHIGNAYTTVAADCAARYHRDLGEDVMFLTGMDEHGMKIQREAEKRNKEPQQYVDEMAADVKTLWETLNISYDRFIRTTDTAHEEAVRWIYEKLYEQGDIYKDEYTGWYCTPCESFWTEAQLVDGNCPDCGRPVEYTHEESYFFRLSKYGDRLLKYFEDHPEFVVPASRAKEMINNFLKPGLQDLAVSRTTFDWGVPLPFDKKHVAYVWIDALSNYITALGYPEDTEDMRTYWPADVHLVGKDIIRFHTIIWPAILMALDLPLPKKVFGHGWLLFDNMKMSKSKGNVVDPVVLSERYGVDAVRYYLLREIPLGTDGNFTNESLVERINADLANDLGNLLSRTTAMIAKYFDGLVPETREAGEPDDELLGQLHALPAKVAESLEDMRFNEALRDIWQVIGRLNKYIDETEPWILGREEGHQARLAAVLGNLAEGLRRVAILIRPFMPDTSEHILDALALTSDDPRRRYDSLDTEDPFRTEQPIEAAKPLFPRLDLDEEIEALNALLDTSQTADAADADDEDATEEDAPDEAPVEHLPNIPFSTFESLELRIATVEACERVPKTDRLLNFTLNMGGGETRTILSGIAEHYAPEEMVGKQVLVVANLEPRKIRGIESQGMILSAENADGTLSVLVPDRPVDAGSQVM